MTEMNRQRPYMTKIRSFVALGDSFTEGLHDDLGADGRHLGWADRVAAGLAGAGDPVRYANLAVRGRLLDAVVVEQVPVAVDLAPDLVSFHAGPNDVLRPKVELPRLLERYDTAVGRLRDVAGSVVLFTVIGRTGGRGRTFDRIAERFAIFNEGVRATADRHDCVVVDVGAEPVMGDPRLWHEDRLHLNREGHRRVAAAVMEALGASHAEPDWWRAALPAPAPVTSLQRAAADARWAGQHLLPWIGRRLRGVSSGDAITPKRPTLADLDPPDLTRPGDSGQG